MQNNYYKNRQVNLNTTVHKLSAKGENNKSTKQQTIANRTHKCNKYIKALQTPGSADRSSATRFWLVHRLVYQHCSGTLWSPVRFHAATVCVVTSRLPSMSQSAKGRRLMGWAASITLGIKGAVYPVVQPVVRGQEIKKKTCKSGNP